MFINQWIQLILSILSYIHFTELALKTVSSSFDAKLQLSDPTNALFFRHLFLQLCHCSCLPSPTSQSFTTSTSMPPSPSLWTFPQSHLQHHPRTMYELDLSFPTERSTTMSHYMASNAFITIWLDFKSTQNHNHKTIVWCIRDGSTHHRGCQMDPMPTGPPRAALTSLLLLTHLASLSINSPSYAVTHKPGNLFHVWLLWLTSWNGSEQICNFFFLEQKSLPAKIVSDDGARWSWGVDGKGEIM